MYQKRGQLSRCLFVGILLAFLGWTSSAASACQNDRKINKLVHQWYANPRKKTATDEEVFAHIRIPLKLYSFGKCGQIKLVTLRLSNMASSDQEVLWDRWRAIAKLGGEGIKLLAKSPDREVILNEYRSYTAPPVKQMVKKRFQNLKFTGEEEKVRLVLVQP